MTIKINNSEIKISNWLLIFGAWFANKVYKDYCKKATNSKTEKDA